jgi:hypothetical protein
MQIGAVRNVAVAILALVMLAALVIVLIPRVQFETTCGGRCVSNVRVLTGLLESAPPAVRDADLLVYLVEKADLQRDPEILFCPGDPRTRGADHRTSYAFRRLDDPACRVKPGVALVADDSEDHHDGKGFVVGYAGGTVTWRDKLRDWGLDNYDTRVVVGPDSIVPELRCLSAD